MKIYLDIDGVLVGQGWKPALYVTEFLKAATEKHDCYWATTHCRGWVGPVFEYLKDIITPEALAYCEHIKITEWDYQKSEVIDLASDFLWFEDQPSEEDKETLGKAGKLDSLIIVDLINNPNHLKDLTELLK